MPATTDPIRVDTFALDSCYVLTLWDTGRTDRDGKSRIRYSLTIDGRELFAGDDFHCSPLHAIDSPETAGTLLTFLTLGEQDTDGEYFDGYTADQLAWRDESPDRENLAFEAMILAGEIDPE